MFSKGIITTSSIGKYRYPYALQRASKASNLQQLSRTLTSARGMIPTTYTCDIDVEPLYRYQTGGYHPVTLGDCFNDGRYKVLHKLGWGGFSTVWAAKDLRDHKYVALKVSIASAKGKNREIKVMHAIKKLHSEEAGAQHVMQLLDHFDHEGPNGKHECLVLEWLGPSITDVLEVRFADRLPVALAKSTARQALIGLVYLHKHRIGHGDLHTRNLASTIPALHDFTESELLDRLGQPNTGPVTRDDGNPLEPGVPAYLVRPTSFPTDVSSSQQQIKIIDFGESFLEDDVPTTLHTPLCVRAPEVIFEEKVDYRVDLWSAGCLIFELIVGQPPLDSIMATPASAAYQMLETASDRLPERWQQKWQALDSERAGNEVENNLQEWLEETYFDGVRREDLTREKIVKLGTLLRKLLRFEPSSRASAQEILQDPWWETR